MDVNTFALSALIAFNITAINNKQHDAYNNASIALYKQSGIEKNIQNYVDNHTTSELRSYTGKTVFVIRSITEQKITFEMTF